MRILPLLVLCLAFVFGVNAGISVVVKPIKTAYSAYKFFKKLLVDDADKPLTNYSGHQEGSIFLQTCKIKDTDSYIHFMTQMLFDEYSTNLFQQVEVACTSGMTLNQLSKTMENWKGDGWYVSAANVMARVKRIPAKCVHGMRIGCTNSVDTYISYGTKPNWGWNWDQLNKWDSEVENKINSCNVEC